MVALASVNIRRRSPCTRMAHREPCSRGGHVLLTLLAMDIACKEIHTGCGSSKRLKPLEAFMIILSFTELLYYFATHAGSVMREGYANANGSRAVKNPNYGTPAATAVRFFAEAARFVAALCIPLLCDSRL